MLADQTLAVAYTRRSTFSHVGRDVQVQMKEVVADDRGRPAVEAGEEHSAHVVVPGPSEPITVPFRLARRAEIEI